MYKLPVHKNSVVLLVTCVLGKHCHDIVPEVMELAHIMPVKVRLAFTILIIFSSARVVLPPIIFILVLVIGVVVVPFLVLTFPALCQLGCSQPVLLPAFH